MIVIEQEIMGDEGLSLIPYLDSNGNWTVGVGHKLKSPCGPITLEYAGKLLAEDIKIARAAVMRNIPCFGELNEERQYVLINMCFQLGPTGLLGFKKMLLALENKAYSTAAAEMLDSKWHRLDSPKRAERLAKIMKTGVMPK